jgi:hypothetical protein
MIPAMDMVLVNDPVIELERVMLTDGELVKDMDPVEVKDPVMELVSD